MVSLETFLGKNKKKLYRQQEKHKNTKQKLISIKKKQRRQYSILKIKKNKFKNFRNNCLSKKLARILFKNNNYSNLKIYQKKWMKNIKIRFLH
jgi:hypothetical protein